MKLLNKENSSKIFNALIVTFAFAAMCHLILVTVMAIVKQDIAFVNPLDFLGVSILLPQYRESPVVAGIGWLALGGLFLVILYVRHHYQIYVSVIRENRLATHLAQTTRQLKDSVIKKVVLQGEPANTEEKMAEQLAEQGSK